MQILINGTDGEGNTINENFDDIEEAIDFLESIKKQV